MGKNVRLNSPEWINLVFEGRNKEYGAYQLRSTSGRRHYWGILVVVILVAAISVLPAFIEKVASAANQSLGQIDATVELADIKDLEEEKLEDLIQQEAQAAAPPPPLKSTIQFTPPVITDDDDIGADEGMSTQHELTESRVQISVQTVDGVDSPDAIDIAELKEQRQIVAEPKDEPYVFVEQMPTFPGGEAALRRYISSETRYPSIALENGIQGRVVIKFVVESDGSVGHVEVLAGVDRSLNEEALRVVRTLPKWIPGRQNGVAVRVYFTVPVVFELQ